MHNHLQVSSLKSVFVNEKIFISFYKISIFAFVMIVLDKALAIAIRIIAIAIAIVAKKAIEYSNMQ